MYLSTTNLRIAPDSAIDLHLHTTNSHGSWTPAALIDHLHREGFGLAAFTDHDCADPAAHAATQQMAREKGMPVLVGVEMSSTWQGEMVDLLCFGFDLRQGHLDALARDLLRRQQDNTREVYENLRRQGYDLPLEALPAVLTQIAVEQPHGLAALLREHGYGLGDPSAGKILLDAGCAFAFNDPAAVVEAAHRDGAVCLLAHPGRGDGFVSYDAALLDAFRQIAPVDGLETDYPRHTPAQVAMFREYAALHQLLTSAGSDSHGPEKPPIRYPAALSRPLLDRLGIGETRR